MGLFGRIINGTLSPLGVRLSRVVRQTDPIVKIATPWDSHREFAPLCDHINGTTLVNRPDAYHLYQLAKNAEHIPGEAAEVGVYKGGTAYLFASIFRRSGKTLHLFDTFTGMPETDAKRDWHTAGDFADTSVEGVKAFLKDFTNVSLYAGFFPATADPIRDSRFAFVHVDVDIYASVKACCEFFYPRMTTGGAIVFDDYGRSTCPGAMQGVDEFFADKPEVPLYFESGQCFILKQ